MKVSVLTTATFLSAFAIFYGTMYPTIGGGDSAELVTAVCSGGVIHPPGYPLWTMINEVFLSLLSNYTPAYAANLLNVIISALCGAVLVGTVFKLTNSTSSSIVAASLFMFSKTSWNYSVVAEVFALNNLLTALTIYTAVIFAKFIFEAKSFELCVGAPRSKKSENPIPNQENHQKHKQSVCFIACVGSFLMGCSLANQHTSVLTFVVVVPWVLYEGRHILLGFKTVMLLLFSFAFGIFPYLYIPYRSYNLVRNTRNSSHPVMTWGDQRTAEGFWSHFLRREYGTFDLTKSNIQTGPIQILKFFLWTFYKEGVGGLSVILFIVGFFAWNRGIEHSAYKKLRILMAITPCFYIFFFNWRANIDTSSQLMAGVLLRFWMQPHLYFCVFSGVGFSFIERKALQYYSAKNMYIRASLGPAFSVCIVASLIKINFNTCDQSGSFWIHTYGGSIISALPENSILLLLGDLPGNAARYMQICEDRRVDVSLLDLQMMNYEWYKNMLQRNFPSVELPGRAYNQGHENYMMKEFLDANYEKHRFRRKKSGYHGGIFTFVGLREDDTTWQSSYQLWKHGLVHRVVKKNDKSVKKANDVLCSRAWLKQALQSVTPAAAFPLPSNTKYMKDSWENVVRTTFEAAGVELAIFLESKAKILIASKSNRKASKKKGVCILKHAARIYDALFGLFDNSNDHPLLDSDASIINDDGVAPTDIVQNRHLKKDTPFKKSFSFWHKNYGIVLQSLLVETQNVQYWRLLQHHWSSYLASQSGKLDAQYDAIKGVLQQYSMTFNS